MATPPFPFKAAVIQEASGLRRGQVVSVTGDDGADQFAVAEATGGLVAKTALVPLEPDVPSPAPPAPGGGSDVDKDKLKSSLKEYGLQESRWMDIFTKEQILTVEDLNEFLSSSEDPFDEYATAVERKKFSRMKEKADSMKRLKEWVDFAELETDKWVDILEKQGIVTEEDLLKVTDTKAAVIAMKSRDVGEQERVRNLFRLDLDSEDGMVRCLKGCRILVPRDEVHEHNCAATTNEILRDLRRELKDVKKRLKALEARAGSSV